MFIYLFLRESTRASGVGPEREGDRIGSGFRAVSTEPDMGLEPMNYEIAT